ncbi:hypothetical protein [Bradyrhizobium sp. STM 3562]
MCAERAEPYPVDPHLEPRDPPDRKLRNRILLANMMAWVAIIAFVRFIFC